MDKNIERMRAITRPILVLYGIVMLSMMEIMSMAYGWEYDEMWGYLVAGMVAWYFPDRTMRYLLERRKR